MKTIVKYHKAWCEKNNFYTFRCDSPELRTFLDDFSIKQDEKQQLLDLKIDINIPKKHRTLNQNALMWALYDIEAKELNGKMTGHKDHEITPKELYENDINEYADKIYLSIPEKNQYLLNSTFRKNRIIKKELGRIFAEIHVTSSHFSTIQMTIWIDRIFNRLAHMGVSVSSSGQVLDYWKDHRKFINDKQLNIDSEIISIREYKEKHPICEATGKYIGVEGGSIAHIIARGMGGKHEDWKDRPYNLLHLCDTAHAEFDNGKGRDLFVNKYPHLKYKINQAYLRKGNHE